MQILVLIAENGETELPLAVNWESVSPSPGVTFLRQSGRKPSAVTREGGILTKDSIIVLHVVVGFKISKRTTGDGCA